MYSRSAEEYDRIYEEKDYASESALVRQIIEEHRPGARTLLDLACGTGRHLSHLKRWYECEGLDLSPEMIESARKKLPGVKLYVDDMAGFNLSRTFDVVVCLFSAIGHLGKIEDLNAAVASMARHVSDPGVVIVEPWIRPDDWISSRMQSDPELDGDGLLALITATAPRVRGRVVMERLAGTSAVVDSLRDEPKMSWFTHDEYSSAFELANLDAVYRPGGLTGRGLYIGTLIGVH